MLGIVHVGDTCCLSLSPLGCFPLDVCASALQVYHPFSSDSPCSPVGLIQVASSKA